MANRALKNYYDANVKPVLDQLNEHKKKLDKWTVDYNVYSKNIDDAIRDKNNYDVPKLVKNVNELDELKDKAQRIKPPRLTPTESNTLANLKVNADAHFAAHPHANYKAYLGLVDDFDAYVKTIDEATNDARTHIVDGWDAIKGHLDDEKVFEDVAELKSKLQKAKKKVEKKEHISKLRHGEYAKVKERGDKINPEASIDNEKLVELYNEQRKNTREIIQKIAGDKARAIPPGKPSDDVVAVKTKQIYRKLLDEGRSIPGAGKKKTTNPWLEHVAEVRAAHPDLAYRDALVKAKESYNRIN